MSLSTEDVLAIQDIYARYNHAIDNGRGEEWAALFTTDGSFTFPGLADVHGQEALVAFGNQVTPGLRHWISNLVIDPTDSGAEGRCYLAAYAVGSEGEGKLVVSGIYHDQLAKTAHGWRFAARHFNPDA